MTNQIHVYEYRHGSAACRIHIDVSEHTQGQPSPTYDNCLSISEPLTPGWTKLKPWKTRLRGKPVRQKHAICF